MTPTRRTVLGGAITAGLLPSPSLTPPPPPPRPRRSHHGGVAACRLALRPRDRRARWVAHIRATLEPRPPRLPPRRSRTSRRSRPHHLRLRPVGRAVDVRRPPVR